MPGPRKGQCRKLRLRIKPYDHGGQYHTWDTDIFVTPSICNAGTPFEYKEYKASQAHLDKALNFGDVVWSSNWDKSRWYAATHYGAPVASVQVLEHQEESDSYIAKTEVRNDKYRPFKNVSKKQITYEQHEINTAASR